MNKTLTFEQGKRYLTSRHGSLVEVVVLEIAPASEGEHYPFVKLKLIFQNPTISWYRHDEFVVMRELSQ